MRPLAALAGAAATVWVAAMGAVLAAAAATPAAGPVAPGSAGPSLLTLEQIMADPDWIGPPVRDAHWSVDGRRIYFTAKRSGSPIVDLHRVDVDSGADAVIDAAAMAQADGAPVFDRARRRAAFIRNGDLFVRDVGNGRLTQITRTSQPQAPTPMPAQTKSQPQWSADGAQLSFRSGEQWFVFDTRTGVTAVAAVLKLENDPDAPPKPDDLRDLQLRTFASLKKMHDDKETLRKEALAMQTGDTSRAAAPFYLGEEVTVLETSLSPDAAWLLVVTEPKKTEVGVEGKLTRYVTESGYEEFDKERTRVGRNPPAGQSLILLNLKEHTSFPLPVDGLPGIHDDPLSAVREENENVEGGAGKAAVKNAAAPGVGSQDAAGAGADAAAGPKLRAVVVTPKGPDGVAGGMRWSADGRRAAIELRAVDHKDRWIASVDFAHHALVPEHRLSDPAWVNWRFNEFGWLPDDATLWYASEESGFAHLYVKAGGTARALTSGRFEVWDPQPSADGKWFYVQSNAEAPYAADVYRVPVRGGALQRLTHLQGVESFALDRAAAKLLVTHSSSYVPAQLAVIRADGSGAVRELTDTRTPGYRAMSWLAPEIVQVPSSQIHGAIYAKLYRPAGTANAAARGAAVVFVHGAGYTQDVHLRFPYYFREQMFHNFLVQRGYVVIDLDYRASSGYGRDWRTAIYRQMGHPELDDLLDGKRWLVAHAGVDPHRVGVYGGSYGGFMTLMAMFRAPGEFAAGAALRPVTDWMQYNDNYTAAILNDPKVDPIAYARSSPLEFAAGLKDPLLICHGVIDDNVLFEDSMRLYQRLVELHKDNFTISPYPLDSHGFVNADSWLDEYKRIARLFDGTLRP